MKLPLDSTESVENGIIQILKSRITPKCSQCGSQLIFVSEETELREGSRFPQTTTKYRCSNEPCQEEKDKQTAKRMKILQDKAVADQKRLEDKQEKKKHNA